MPILGRGLDRAKEGLPRTRGNANDCESDLVAAAVAGVVAGLEELWATIDSTITDLAQDTRDTIEVYAGLEASAVASLRAVMS